MIVFKFWHDLLDMPVKDEQWHVDDIADELAELHEAKGLVNIWSELSDVVYTVTRTRWDGYAMNFPLTKWQLVLGMLYMFPKYTSRWLFFYTAGRRAKSPRRLTEVRNPVKVHKLHHIAGKYEIDPQEFARICHQQLRYWPLLK